MILCGVDEVGRGCLAGAVFAAAVIFPQGYYHADITDSKKLSDTQRRMLVPIIQRDAIAYAVASASVEEIEKYNILQATFIAMHRAIAQLNRAIDWIEVDGNRFKPYPNMKHRCIVKGDQSHIHIAAASILAKVARDSYMTRLSEKFPDYQWQQNKGYPTQAHRAAIASKGVTPHHRKSFHLY